MPTKKSRSGAAAGSRPAAPNSTAMTSAARVIGSAVGKVVARTGRLLHGERAHPTAGSGEATQSDRTAATAKRTGGAKQASSQKPARKRSRAARTKGRTKTS